MQGWRQAPRDQAVSWGPPTSSQGQHRAGWEGEPGPRPRWGLILGEITLAAGPQGVGKLGWGRTAEALHPVRGSGKPDWVGSGESASTKALASFSRHRTPLSQGARPPRTAAGEQQ